MPLSRMVSVRASLSAAMDGENRVVLEQRTIGQWPQKRSCRRHRTRWRISSRKNLGSNTTSGSSGEGLLHLGLKPSVSGLCVSTVMDRIGLGSVDEGTRPDMRAPAEVSVPNCISRSGLRRRLRGRLHFSRTCWHAAFAGRPTAEHGT